MMKLLATTAMWSSGTRWATHTADVPVSSIRTGQDGAGQGKNDMGNEKSYKVQAGSAATHTTGAHMPSK